MSYSTKNCIDLFLGSSTLVGNLGEGFRKKGTGGRETEVRCSVGRQVSGGSWRWQSEPGNWRYMSSPLATPFNQNSPDYSPVETP